jgi:hypothetical protein
MAESPAGLRRENDCTGEEHRNPQLPDSNKSVFTSPKLIPDSKAN